MANKLIAAPVGVPAGGPSGAVPGPAVSIDAAPEPAFWRQVWRRLRRHRLAVAGLFIFLVLVVMSLAAPVLAPYNPNANDYSVQLQGPTRAHWLGTDDFGRDILSRIIWGGRRSLSVGVVAVAIGLGAGLILGAVSGYAGGRLDNLIMRVMDILLAFPSVLLAIAVMSLLGRGLEKAMVAIGIVSIPHYARIVRASVLTIRENDYVVAARASGASHLRVLWRHILPNAMAPIIVRATLGTSEAILEAAALGFLGLGVQPPDAEWGAMLARAQEYIRVAPHVTAFPGLMITLTVLCLNLFGDGLRDALDPRLKN